MNTQIAESEPISGLFDLCGKVQERLTEAHVIANKLVGPIPVDELNTKDADTDYLNNLEHKLRAILRDTGSLVKRLREVEQRF